MIGGLFRNATRPLSVAFAATTLAGSAIGQLMAMFTSQVFFRLYGLQVEHFYTVQILYLVWNAINDPVFAWWFDFAAAKLAGSGGATATLSRAVWQGGPVLVLAFLLPWWPWSEAGNEWHESIIGVQYFVSMFLFDGAFTYVLLAHCGLFAEVTHTQPEREGLLAAQNTATILASAVAIGSHALFPNLIEVQTLAADAVAAELAGFRWLMLAVAAAALACFFATASLVPQLARRLAVSAGSSPPPGGAAVTTLMGDSGGEEPGQRHRRAGSIGATAATSLGGGWSGSEDREGGVDDDGAAAAGQGAESPPAGTPDQAAAPVPTSVSASTPGRRGSEEAGFLAVALDAVRNPAFLVFVAINFLQIGNNSVNGAFYGDFLTLILGEGVSKSTVAGLLGVAAMLPPVVSLATQVLSAGVSQSVHSYDIIRSMFWSKVAMGLVLSALVVRSGQLGEAGAWALALLMVAHRGMAGSTFSFFNITVSDIIDDDQRRHARGRKMSTAFFGLNALATKPAESVAQLLVIALLAPHGFTAGVADGEPAAADAEEEAELRSHVLWLVALVPLLCGVLQSALWSRYPLRASRPKRLHKPAATETAHEVP